MSITALDAAGSSSRSSSMSALNESRLVWRWRAGVGGFAASATARAARSAASSFSWQQRLYFCPLPQWHGSLRPILILVIVADFTKEEKRCGSNHTERAERHPILRAAAGL